MKKKIVILIIVLIFIAILSFVIPVKKEEKLEWIRNGPSSYGHNAKTYYNIYGIKIFKK